ncbi:hypothetical protein ACFL6I_12905 [candidate division KSB1 bacterium]
MNVSEADSLSINNIYNYNYDSDKLIIKEIEKLKEQINLTNQDLTEAYKTKGKLENYKKRYNTVLIILIIATIIFILLFVFFLTQYLSTKQKLHTAQIDIKQANENFSSASEAKLESEKLMKEEIKQQEESNKKLTQQLNSEKHQVYLLNNKISRIEEENRKMKEEFETKFEQAEIEKEKERKELDPEPVDTRKQLDEVEINLLKIEKLSKLKEIGNISEEEFESVKNRILGTL